MIVLVFHLCDSVGSSGGRVQPVVNLGTALKSGGGDPREFEANLPPPILKLFPISPVTSKLCRLH